MLLCSRLSFANPLQKVLKHFPNGSSNSPIYGLQVRQKCLDQQRLERGMTMPSHQELRKLSDEHKALLAQRCVLLLMGKAGKSSGDDVPHPPDVETDSMTSSITSSVTSSISSVVGRGAEARSGGRGSLPKTSAGGRGSLTNESSGGRNSLPGGGGRGSQSSGDQVERRPRSSSKRSHSRSILAAPPLCVPEVQEKTHAKR